MRASSIIILILLLCSQVGKTQNLSNKGKEFWVSYPYNWFFESGNNGQEMRLYFSAEQAATVTLTSHVNNLTWVKTYTVAAGTVKVSDFIPKAGTYDSRLYDLPVSFGGNGGEGFYNKGIHIESTTPIVVYAHYTGLTTSGAAMIFPVEAYGYTYTTINNTQSYSNAYTYFYVMASEDNTVVEITPSVLTRTNKPAGVPFTVTLNKKQSYQIIANSLSGDLTGSKIRSIANSNGECFPIAVFAGSSRTALSCSGPGGGSGDFIMQQVFPSQAWGKRYLTAPTSNGSSASSLMTNIYRVLPKDPATPVLLNGLPMPGFNGVYYQYNSGTADEISSDKPVLVAQYMSSQGACPNTNAPGDPEMIYISPIEQAIKRVGFYRNTEEQITVNYLTLIIPNNGVPSLRIDGSPTFDHSYVHPRLPGYRVIVKRWSAAKAQCIVSSDSAFTAITYGLGSVESYGYNAGTLINNLGVFSEIHNEPDTVNQFNEFTCIGTPMKLSMLVAYKPTKMIWKLSTVSSLTPNADVTDNAPVPTDSVTRLGVKYYRYTLPSTYNFTNVGSFSIPVIVTHPSIENCNNTEAVKIYVTVKPEPHSVAIVAHTGCQLDTVHFNSPTVTPNGHTVRNWTWNFGDATSSNLQNPSKFYSTIGIKNVELDIVTDQGCITDTTFTININDKPTAAFGVSPNVCVGNSITFTDSSTYTGGSAPGTWYWDFGNGNTTSATSSTPQVVTYANPGTYTVKHVVKVTATCISDTTTRQIIVYAKPTAKFTFPTTCITNNGQVQFTNTSTVSDGQALTGFEWDFGDANATPTNPNTSTAENPTHNYSASGTYNVKLKVTTANGCVKDTTIAATFTLAPQMAYPALSPVCGNAASVSVATATPASGASGTGVYKGPGTTSAGMFDPVTAGAGTHTIWYVFTTTGGTCIDSISRTITVAPRPGKPAVTRPVYYCQNDAASPLSGTPATDHTLTWYNNSAITGGSATPPTPSTATAGTTYYYVTQTNTASGCESDTSRIEVTVVPPITGNTIGHDQMICGGTAPALLVSTGTLGGGTSGAGTGTLNFQWEQSTDGGTTWTAITGANSETFSPPAATGTAKYRRIVTSLLSGSTSTLCSSISNVVSIIVQGSLSGTGIAANQTKCAGSPSDIIIGQTPSGGDGNFTFVWESSPDNVAWTTISGATAKDYQPAALTATTYFRRRVTSSICNAISNVVTITINPLPNGSISGTAGVCDFDPYSVNFTASAGTAPFTVVLNVSGPGGYTNTVTQSITGMGPSPVSVLPAGSAAGTYTITFTSLTDNNNCVRTTGLAPVSFEVTAKPVMTVSSPAPICSGGNTTLTASGATTYTWSPATGLSATTGASVVASPTATTTYTVTGSNGGCSTPATVTVTVNPIPAKPTVTSPVNYCQLDPSTPLSATANAGHTLTWYSDAALTMTLPGAPTPSTATAGSTTYYVTQTSPETCRSAAESITVVVQPSVSGNTITADQTVCQGSTPTAISGGTLSGGTGTFTYSWSKSTDGGATWTTVSGATTATHTPSATPGITQYRRVVNSGLCNSTSNIVTITVHAQLTNNSIGSAQTICEGAAPASLTGQLPTGGDGTYTYQWQSSDDGSTWVLIAGATSKDYQPPVLTANTHYRRITTSGPCTSISVPLLITVKPTANGNITGATVCEYDPASVTFTATAGTAPYSIQLSVSGPGGYTNTITQSVGATASISVLPANSVAGNYTVTITSLSDANTCVRTTGFTPATITVNPKPAITVSPNAPICAGGNTTLTASGATTYSWSPATGLSGTTGSSVTANPTVTTTYTVTGTTSGCNATAQVTVTINPVPAKPTVTSPVTYCEGSAAVALSATAAAGNTLTWYDNPGLTGGSTTAPVPSTATAGTVNYYVTQTNGSNCTSQPEIIAVTVQPSITNNTISADQLLCSGAPAAAIGSATSPSGGTGTYTYQWQQSTDGGSVWTLISGATGSTYNPGILAATTQYRRLVSSGLCSSISNVVTKAVQGAVSNTGITANQTVCSGAAPAMLDGQPAGSVTYQWEISPDNISWTNISGATSEDYQPDVLTSTTYYRRKVSNGACSSISNTVTITVNPLPNGAITGSTKCEYDAADITFTSSGGTAPFTLVLNVTGPGGYTATLNRNNVPATATIPVLPANSAPGTYTVAFTSITDNNGCTRTSLASATINITARPVLSIPATVPGCQGTSTTLTVSGATTYAWSPATGLSSTTGSTVTANPASTTTYTVTGTSNGCSSSAPVTVTVNPRPNASFTVDNNVCAESQATFVPATTSSNVTSWRWDFGDGTGVQTYNDGYSFTRPYTTANTFNIKMVTVDANGCVSDTARQSITVRPKPSADFTLPTSICLPNGVANFSNGSTLSDNGALTYVWDLGDQSPAVTTKDVSHVYAANGPYNVTLTATSAYGCKDIESNLLNSDVFFSKPIAKFSVAPEALCQGMDNVFTDESTAPNSTITSWRWNFDDGTAISTTRNPTRRYKNPGTYEVALVVTNAVGCVSDTAKKEVNVFLQPVIDAGPSFVVTAGTEVTFRPKVNDTTLSFTWTPSADFTDPSKLSQKLVAVKDQTYMLSAVGEGGCTATDTLVIKILNAIKIPNAFSPNGDGTNDTWEIPYLKDYPGATVHVYNRFGQQVFTSYGYGRPWDGNYNGKPLPVATYYYVITLKNGFAPVSGSVTIIK